MVDTTSVSSHSSKRDAFPKPPAAAWWRRNSSPARRRQRRGIRVKPVEESAGICGFDAHKPVKGRKRHVLVDTLGLLLAVSVPPADLHDRKGSRGLLTPLLPRLKKIGADAANLGQELAAWCPRRGQLGCGERWSVPQGVRGFSVQPCRWVGERERSLISRELPPFQRL